MISINRNYMSQNLDFFKARKRLRSAIVTVNFFLKLLTRPMNKIGRTKVELAKPKCFIRSITLWNKKLVKFMLH